MMSVPCSVYVEKLSKSAEDESLSSEVMDVPLSDRNEVPERRCGKSTPFWCVGEW